VLFVLLAFSGVGNLLGGALSDRWGRWQLLALCLFLLAPAHWAYLNASGVAQWILVGAIGMLVGATFPMSIVLAQESWPAQVGIASGLVMGLGWVPGGIGASITGMVADRSSLEVGLQLLVVPVMVGAACALAYGVLQRSAIRAAEGTSL
jgi:FSR family fosmidomycin resistance protein-like MFS transporter